VDDFILAMVGQACSVMNELDNADDLISSPSSALSNSFITLQGAGKLVSPLLLLSIDSLRLNQQVIAVNNLTSLPTLASPLNHNLTQLTCSRHLEQYELPPKCTLQPPRNMKRKKWRRNGSAIGTLVNG
jgi:hypothetical protein